MNTYKFCRLCLAPEESDIKLTSIFENNGKLATKIHKISGVTLVDVAGEFPSLVCTKCIAEVEGVDKLRLRILDADEYYTNMTREKEKKLLKNEFRKLTEIKLQSPLRADLMKLQSPRVEVRKLPTPKAKGESKPTTPMIQIPNIRVKALKIKKEKSPNENKFPRKRKLEIEDEEDELSDIPDEEVFIKPSPVGKKPFLPSATPNKLGIHRMIINKSRKSLGKAAANVASIFKTEPADGAKKRKVFRPRLSLPPLRPKSKKNIEIKKEVDCNGCDVIFENDKEPLVVHKSED